jgi:hypothetical protein
VPAGNFDCVKMQWLYDLNQDGEWDDDIIFFDYLCGQGIIKRSILVKDLMIVNENFELVGLADSRAESVLLWLNL